MGKRKRKSIWASKEERDAWNAHVDETVARLRGLAEKAQAEIDRRHTAEGKASP